MSICGALIPLFVINGNFMGIPVPGTTINIYTQVGLVTLGRADLQARHLMVEFANQLQLAEGLDRRAAIEKRRACACARILMTTAAMVVA